LKGEIRNQKMTTKKVFSYLFFLLVCFATIPGFSFAQEKEVLKSADSLKTVTAVVDSTAPEGKKVKKEKV
jgi:CHASE3 domain sensor protein